MKRARKSAVTRLSASRKGVGLTEVIIAMSIIVIVGVAAMSIVTYYSQGSSTTMLQNNAINLVNNALECFKFSADRDQFEGHMTRTLGVRNWPECEDGVLYTYEGFEDMTIVFKVAFYPTYNYAVFSATLRNSNNRVLYSVTNYTKYLPSKS